MGRTVKWFSINTVLSLRVQDDEGSVLLRSLLPLPLLLNDEDICASSNDDIYTKTYMKGAKEYNEVPCVVRKMNYSLVLEIKEIGIR